jgi:hypothetical protein
VNEVERWILSATKEEEEEKEKNEESRREPLPYVFNDIGSQFICHLP